MIYNPLSSEGYKISFSAFPFIPGEDRKPYDCAHLSWVALTHPVLDRLGLGRMIVRAYRYIIEDINDVVYLVGSYRSAVRGFIIYEDMNPYLLNSNKSLLLERCDGVMLQKIFTQCYPEDVIYALHKAGEEDMTFEKIQNYLSFSRSVISFDI